MNTFELLPHETILPDDYPIVPFYVYIVDGVFWRSLFEFETSVAGAKVILGASEIRRCDLFGHPGAKLGDGCIARAEVGQ